MIEALQLHSSNTQPASLLTLIPKSLPPNCLLLNCTFQHICAYSADLNSELPVRHSGRPSLAQTAQLQPWTSHYTIYLHSAHFYFCSVIMICPCPWKAPKLHMHLVFKSVLYCVFYEFQLPPAKFTDTERRRDTWEGAGTFSAVCSSRIHTL